MVAGVRHIQVPRHVRHHPGWHIQLSLHGRASVPAVAARARARQGRDRPPAHLAHAVVRKVCDVQIARTVQRNPPRRVQQGRSRRPSVACIARGAGSRHGSNDPRAQVHPANHVVVGVRDVQRVIPVERDAAGIRQVGLRRLPAVARVAFLPAYAGNRRDDPRHRIHHADRMVGAIRDVQVARAVQLCIGGCIQHCRRRQSTIPGEPGRPIAGHRGDDAGHRIYSADPLVVGVGQKQVPRGIGRAAHRQKQRGLGRQPAVAAIDPLAVAGYGSDHAGNEDPGCAHAGRDQQFAAQQASIARPQQHSALALAGIPGLEGHPHAARLPREVA